VKTASNLPHPAEVSLPGQPTQENTRIDYQSTDTPHDNSDIPMEIDNTDLPGVIDDQHQPDTSSFNIIRRSFEVPAVHMEE
jgi:hypothetical protein